MTDQEDLSSRICMNELPPPVTQSRRSISSESNSPIILLPINTIGQHNEAKPYPNSDKIERLLCSKKVSPEKCQLLDDYSQFKLRPDRGFFHQMVQLSSYEPSTTQESSYLPNEPPNVEKSFSEHLDHFIDAIQNNTESTCVRTW